MLSDEQIRSYLEDPLEPEARESLEEQIAQDPEALQKILDHRRIDQGLHVLLGHSDQQERVKQSVLAVLEGPSPEILRNLVLREAEVDPELVRSGNRALVWSAIALAACVAIAALLLNQLTLPQTPAQVARLDQIQGAVTVSRQIGAPLAASNQFALQPGDTVSVPRDGSATIDYPDGTALHLSGDTRVTLGAATGARGNLVQMLSGDMNATVGDSTGNHPLTVATPQATVTSNKGEIQLNASTGSTQLNVNAGSARIAQNGAPQSTEITAGQSIRSAPGTLFHPQPIPSWPNRRTTPPSNLRPMQQIVPPSTNNFRPMPQTTPQQQQSPQYFHPIQPSSTSQPQRKLILKQSPSRPRRITNPPGSPPAP